MPPPPPASGPPPAWYPEPSGQPGVRWWDGTRWTEHVSRPPAYSMSLGPQVGTGRGVVDLAQWWPRFGAYVIDVIIVAIPSVIIGAIVGTFTLATSTNVVGHLPLGAGAQAVVILTVVAIALGYPYLLLRYRGQTVGMMALRIRAIDRVAGAPLTTRQTWTRVLTFFFLTTFWGQISSLILFNRSTSTVPPAGLALEFLGFALTLLTGLWPLGNPLNQTLQDKAAGTIVVRDQPQSF